MSQTFGSVTTSISRGLTELCSTKVPWRQHGQAKFAREKEKLGLTQLCRHLDNCRHYQRGNCAFAHSLMDLKDVPPSWTTTKGHKWCPGDPLPERHVQELIRKYAEKAHEIPPWAKSLLIGIGEQQRAQRASAYDQRSSSSNEPPPPNRYGRERVKLISKKQKLI